MKNDRTDLEQRLLSKASLDELIKLKMEEEMKAELEEIQKKSEQIVEKDITKIPQSLIFSKQSVFKIFNRTTKSETFISGLQAESLLGTQNIVREKISSAQLDAFSTENAYVKFEYAIF